MLAVVELYCGPEKPFSKIAEALGYTATTVDPHRDAGATVTAKITEDLAIRLPKKPLIVWASPPWSPLFLDTSAWASDGSFAPENQQAEEAMELVRQTIRLITAMNPAWWFLEHPKSLMRRMPLFAGFNRGYPNRNRRTIVHQRFGGEGSDVSDIWTNAFWWLPNSPDGGEPDTSQAEHHARVPAFVYAQMFEKLETYKHTGVITY